MVRQNKLSVEAAVNRIVTEFSKRGWQTSGDIALEIARLLSADGHNSSVATAAASVPRLYLSANKITRKDIQDALLAAVGDALITSASSSDNHGSWRDNELVADVPSGSTSEDRSIDTVQLRTRHKQSANDNLSVDVLILTALEKELLAVLSYGRGWQQRRGSGSNRVYHVTTSRYGVHIAVACSYSMGPTNAATLATDAVRDVHPRFVLLAGIAAGIRGHVSLGDIVIGEQVADYDQQKLMPERAEYRWAVYPGDSKLLSIASELMEADWVDRVTVQRPDGEPRSLSQVRRGIVLSGNKVVADDHTAGELGASWVRAIAIEMEGAGVAAGLHQSATRPGFLLVKGVCDFADPGKEDSWQEYAAHASASYVMALSDTPVISSSWPTAGGSRTSAESGLRAALDAAFSLDDLRALVFDLGVDWDNIAGETKERKILELIGWLSKRGRIGELVGYVHQVRPHLRLD